MLRRVARSILPRPIRHALLNMYARMNPVPTAEGWDRHARFSRYAVGAGEGKRFGDQWTTPAALGAVGVTPERFMDYLDETMIRPYFKPGGTVLEIGAGGGRLTEILLRSCDRVIAADTGATMIRLLRERFSDNPKVEYMRLDGRGLAGIADRTLDKVFSYDVFVHLMQWDIYQYLIEIRRVLKRGGRAILHHANMFSELGWKEFVHAVPINLNKHKKFDTFSAMTPEMMCGLVERAGLIVHAVREDIVPRDCVTIIESPQTA